MKNKIINLDNLNEVQSVSPFSNLVTILKKEKITIKKVGFFISFSQMNSQTKMK